MNKKIRILNIILSLILIGIVVVHFLFEVPALHFSQPIIEEWEDDFASGGGFGDALSDAIRSLGTDSHYFPSFAEIETFLKENWNAGDLVLTMGAGDVVKIGEDLLK